MSLYVKRGYFIASEKRLFYWMWKEVNLFSHDTHWFFCEKLINKYFRLRVCFWYKSCFINFVAVREGARRMCTKIQSVEKRVTINKPPFLSTLHSTSFLHTEKSTSESCEMKPNWDCNHKLFRLIYTSFFRLLNQ